MKLFVAPTEIVWSKLDWDKPTVFLAGGITDCPEWQDEVIKKLDDIEAYVFNPRRKNFPIHDPSAAREQIKWEFDALERCDLFTMWFSAGKSDQPICMYELGRNIALHTMSPYSPITIAIGVEPSYRREQDVKIQLELIDPNIKITDSIDDHVANIKKAVETWRSRKTQ